MLQPLVIVTFSSCQAYYCFQKGVHVIEHHSHHLRVRNSMVS